MRIRLLLVVIVAAMGCSVLGAEAEEIAVDVLFQPAKYGAVRISPNGLYVAVVMRRNGRANLGILDLNTRDAKVITNFDNADVQQVRWLNNSRLLVAIGGGQDANGIADVRGWYAVNLDGSNGAQLTVNKATVAGRDEHLVPRLAMRGFTFLGSAEDGSSDIFVADYERGPTVNDVFRVDTQTGRYRLLTADSPGDVLSWVVDQQGVPRIALAQVKGVQTLWYRDTDKSPWIAVDSGKVFQTRISPLVFGGDNRSLYVLASNESDKTGIHVYDLQRKKLTEVVAASPQADITTLIWSRTKHDALGARFEGDTPGVAWFDAGIARLQKAVDQVLPNTFNSLQVAEENPHRAVVYAYSDLNPGTIYLLDTEKLSLEEVARTRPWIDPKKMAHRKPIRYIARDGLEIPAYLTLPTGATDTKPPLVVIVHGGPFVRGFYWGFDQEAQFFASRGYAVLEPEYRGTPGYGRKLLISGFKQWGLAMQDDITDGVEWLIKQGIVDKDRVCLFGGSYGGYATLWGLIKTPDLYRCGVASFAVTDIELMFDIAWSDMARSTYGWLDYGARDVIGDPDKDREKFRSVSPLYNAEKLKTPVLLAYGGSDERVPQKHGNDFRAALDKYGKTYEWVLYPDAGHGFSKDEDRYDFYRRVDAFLKKYLR